MYKICFVEDEKSLNNLMKSYMEKEGYHVVQFYDGTSALEYIGKEEVNLWILDIMLGDSVSGYDLIKKIRQSDDYVTKPYSPKELMLRIGNILKRVYNNSQILKYENYEIDIDKRIVTDNTKEVNLTTLEFDLLNLLLRNIGKSFSRDDILNQVWGSDYFGSDRVVDDLVRRLRKKMPKLKVNTIYGFGYRLV